MKIKIIALSSILLSGLLLSSCRTYLTPAILGSNMVYMPRPMASDSIKKSLNVSGSYAASISPGKIIGFQMGMLNVSRSHTFKSFNLSYGLFGYLGEATFNSNLSAESYPQGADILSSFNKTISGIGLRTTAGFHLTSSNGKTDFRIINWENSISTESGAYADFRQQVYNNNVYRRTYASNKNTLWTTGFSTEIISALRENNEVKLGVKLFIGATPGLLKSFNFNSAYPNENDITNSTSWAFSSFFSVKKFSFTYEIANNVNFSNRLSLGYSF